MLLITPILAGIILGVAMPLLFGRHALIIPGVITGIIGALIVRFIVYAAYDSHQVAPLSFSWVGVLSSLIGAAIGCYLLMLVPRRKLDKEE